VPLEDLDSNKDGTSDIVDAGSVNVIYGSVGGLNASQVLKNQSFTQDSDDYGAESYDYFGLSLSAGDYNADNFTDLAVGVPGEDVGSVNSGGPNIGIVNVIYGSEEGLSAATKNLSQIISQGLWDLEGDAETDDFFGSTLSSGDYNGDGKDDLAIGVPGEDVKNVSNAGSVNVIYGSVEGLNSSLILKDQQWNRGSGDLADTNNFYGSALSSGDYNGDGKDDLTIGVPGEDIEGIVDAGRVSTIYGSDSGLNATLVLKSQRWDQGSGNIEDSRESADRFGSTLSSGDYNGDGKDDLTIGVPGEDIEGIVDAGRVSTIYGSDSGLNATLVLQS
jgi:hypothetical protein